jgi:hypothetical protein
MTQTLANLISDNTFEGYEIEQNNWFMEPDDIETALYGSNASYNVDYEVLDKLDANNTIEQIHLSKWLCTDTHVGLSVIRLNNRPVAILWHPARKANKVLTFICEEGLTLFRTAWEAAKPNIETDAQIASDTLLNMPVNFVEHKAFQTESTKDGTPTLSERGITQWISFENGIENITHTPALKSALHTLRHILTLKNQEIQDMTQIMEEEQFIYPEDFIKKTMKDRNETTFTIEAMQYHIESLT